MRRQTLSEGTGAATRATHVERSPDPGAGRGRKTPETSAGRSSRTDNVTAPGAAVRCPMIGCIPHPKQASAGPSLFQSLRCRNVIVDPAMPADQGGIVEDAGGKLKGLDLARLGGRDRSPRHINLLTLRSAKGREYNVVITVGMDMRAIPWRNERPLSCARAAGLLYRSRSRPGCCSHALFRLGARSVRASIPRPLALRRTVGGTLERSRAGRAVLTNLTNLCSFHIFGCGGVHAQIENERGSDESRTEPLGPQRCSGRAAQGER